MESRLFPRPCWKREFSNTNKSSLISEFKNAIYQNDLEAEIHQTEKELCDMLGDLTGSESDMQGIRELRILLGGSEDE